MSSVLDPAELSASPLADLHTIANELGLDGFRRLRKAELVDAILVAQGGEPVAPAEEAPAPKPRSRSRSRAKVDADPEAEAEAEAVVEPETETPAPGEAEAEADGEDDERPGRRRSRGGRSRSRRAAEETEEATAAGDEADATEEEDRPRRRTRAGRGRSAAAPEEPASTPATAGDADGDRLAVGPIELAGNGSGFIRVNAPEVSDDDVYVSAAQVKRCELVSGDTVAGPVRPPRRSERHPSLIRVDTINGRPADEVSGEGTRFEDLPAAFPSERFELGSEDATVKAIEWLTPFGKGSRVTVLGPAQSGKTETLLRLAAALGTIEGLELSVVLAGARPEELPLWTEGGRAPAATSLLGSSPEAQAQVIEQVVDQAKRQAARGADAVVIIDSVDQLQLQPARRALAAARNLVDGGSLTIIAGAPVPVGGETTTIALDQILTSLRRFPALDLAAGGTLRPELLVGEAGAEAIAKAREETLRV